MIGRAPDGPFDGTRHAAVPHRSAARRSCPGDPSGGLLSSNVADVLRLSPTCVGLVAAAWLGACGGGGRGDGCDDPDRDGFGPGCPAGEEDCDPRNPARTDDCDRVPPPDCEATPDAPGCPCLPRSRRVCFDGPPEAQGVAACVPGVRICNEGIDTWGFCEGQVAPGPERCNDVDDDCDGLTDESVRSPCGGCDPSCRGTAWGDDADPFELAAGDADLVLTATGALTLVRDPVDISGAVWVPSSDDGLVSKIDAESQRVVAQYATRGTEPSRVAVDYDGDAWVATRSFDAQSTVMKIAGSRDRCVDADGDGSIATSSGPGDVLPAGADECVLFEVDVGEPGAVARALAIDGSTGLDGLRGGQVWVGLHETQEVLELDSETGMVVDRVATPGLRPYAAVVDIFGTLWVASRDGKLAEIDRGARPLQATIRPVPFACFLTYGIATDLRGRIYLTAFSCDGIHRFDPTTDAWRFFGAPESVRGATLGDVVADPESQEIWVAHTAAQLSRVRLDPTLRVVDTIDLADGPVSPLESIGVAVDAFGAVWVASTAGGPDGTGLVTRVDPTGVEDPVHLPVGRGPHVQGDLTGADLVGGFRSDGTIRRVFRGCGSGGDTLWNQVHLDFRAGVAGRVTVRARHATDEAGLGDASFADLGTAPDQPLPFPLPDETFPDGGVVELEVTLGTAARDSAPELRLVGLEWSCPGPI